MSESYKKAGVDVEAGYEAVRLMKEHVRKTYTKNVISDIGGFGALFSLNKDEYEEPVLVSGTDGVGTKLKLAFLMDKHDTVGIDCVAMCVNDVVCQGAKPLFFLDYIAIGKNIPQKVSEIVKGISNGCIQAGCALIGGETAEMPGFYNEGEYDIAGFAVGVVDRKNIIDGSNLKIGDTLIGLASSGVHSNGFSLVRKVFDINTERLNTYFDSLGKTLGEALIEPTKIYVKPILALINKFEIKAISHITGGGFYENIPRMLPKNLKAIIDKESFPIPPIFKLIQKVGDIPEKDMYNTFNMGIGMVIAVNREDAEDVLDYLHQIGETAYIIGDVAYGDNGVEII